MVSNTAVKKAGRVVVKAPTKRIKKEIKSLRRGLNKEIALSKKISNKTSRNALKQGTDLELLKREIEKLKKRRKKSGLSAYNRFMRAQIKKGISFKSAARLWQRQKKAVAKKNRKRSGYNVFISLQLKQGKTMKQAIRAWNLLKNPVKKKKAKPKIIVKRARPRKAVAKRARVGKSVSREDLARILAASFAKVNESAEKRESSIKELFSRKTVPAAIVGQEESNEELALKLLDIFFREVARLGLKRSLSLDEVIDSYFYSLLRMQRNGIELQEICSIVKNKKF